MWYTYIVASKKNWTIYVWVTSDLEKRMYEHTNWISEWFTKKYWCKILVWYQKFEDIKEAIDYEKKIKWWKRKKKILL